MKTISRQGLNNSSAKNINKITVTKYKGVLTGDIISEPIVSVITEVCIAQAFDLSCKDNSQYIPII